ncbi:MAG: hypothetical protein U9N52_00205 [Campylobacterota bacterium]|nr:hypothetical protein [Campylobacterota bacterium]
MYKTLLATTALLALFTGCNDSIDTPAVTELPGGFTVMDSATGNIPYPNDILFAGSTDGTLNIPYAPDASDAVVKSALNTLDGFSTSSPISIALTENMLNSSLPGNVRVFKAVAGASQATNFIPAIGAITGELTFGVDFVAQVKDKRLYIVPTKLLDPSSTYVVALTKGIQNDKGQLLATDGISELINGTKALFDFATGTSDYYFDDLATAASLEGLRQLNQARYAALSTQTGMECAPVPEDQAITCNNIITSWNFTTQSIGNVAKAFSENNPSNSSIGVVATGLSTAAIGGAGIADIYAGALQGIPYYLGTPSALNPVAPLTQSFLDENGSNIIKSLPAVQSTKTVPLLITVPNIMAEPASGWPVVIFQHGITQNRTNLLAIADSFASKGYAAVAIDLPLHGLENNTTGLKTNYERTFDLDIDQDGNPDASGAYYMNLANLLVARDNIRQSTSDLIALYNALSRVSGAKLDSSRIAFMGHSLGTIAAFGFLDSQRALESATLAMPGGGIAQLLNHSPAFGQEIRDQLESLAGIAPDSEAYNSFMLAAQTVLDDADSINYAASAGTKHSYFAIEAIGDGSDGSGDQTIPNYIPTAPLSGTDPLLAYMGFTDINASASGSVALTGNTVSRFIVGGHSSILIPDTATQEMQGQTASFIGSQAQEIVIGDNSLLKQ